MLDTESRSAVSCSSKTPHVAEMLTLGRSKLDVAVRTLMMVDSLEIGVDDRELIVEHRRKASENRVVMTHGTDTMDDTARALGKRLCRARPFCSPAR
jgi:L-asparaginase